MFKRGLIVLLGFSLFASSASATMLDELSKKVDVSGIAFVRYLQDFGDNGGGRAGFLD